MVDPDARNRCRSAVSYLLTSRSEPILTLLLCIDTRATRYSQGTPHHIAFRSASKPYNAKEG